MNLTDRTLQEALATLTPAERAAFTDFLRAAPWADGEEKRHLIAAARRKLKFALKRRARSRKEARNTFKWLN